MTAWKHSILVLFPGREFSGTHGDMKQSVFLLVVVLLCIHLLVFPLSLMTFHSVFMLRFAEELQVYGPRISQNEQPTCFTLLQTIFAFISLCISFFSISPLSFSLSLVLSRSPFHFAHISTFAAPFVAPFGDKALWRHERSRATSFCHI